MLIEQSVEDNYLSRLDPRVKILFGLELIVLFTVITDIYLILLLMIFPVSIYIYLNSIKSLISMLWSFKWYFIIFIIFGYFLTQALSLLEIGFLIIKFTGLFLAFAVLSRTTNPDEVTDVLIKIKLPPNLAWKIGTTLRQVYFIYGEIIHIRKIQEINYDFSETSRMEKISNLITTLYANSIIRADMFSLTLQSRGYKGAHKEIITYSSNFTQHDFVGLLIAIFPTIIYLIFSSQLFI